VKAAALELGLPVRQPESLRDPDVLAELAATRPEAGVGVAYGQILRREVLDIPARGIINVHPSLLPRHRGASPVPAAILAGGKTGVTVMLMTPAWIAGRTGPAARSHPTRYDGHSGRLPHRRRTAGGNAPPGCGARSATPGRLVARRRC
jgi:methionyl-tRNA formyltransferase